MRSALTSSDSRFLTLLRAGAVIAILFGHLGGFYGMKPCSGLLRVAVPVFFFISGAVTWLSFLRAGSGRFFLVKRMAGLLVPYYLLCLVLLVTYLIEFGTVPLFSWKGLGRWLLIAPANEMMFFPVGQVWFLQVLVCMMVVFPIVYAIHQRVRMLLYIVIGVTFLVPGVQLFVPVAPNFKVSIVNLYYPIAYGSFFMFGMVYFTTLSDSMNLRRHLITAILFAVLAAGIAVFTQCSLDSADHVFPPDLFFIAVSYSMLLLILSCRHHLSGTMERWRVVRVTALFIQRHAMSVFLLYSFARHLAVCMQFHFGAIPQDKWFNVQHVLVTVFLLLLLIVPFSRLHQTSTTFLVNFIGNSSRKHA